MTKAEADVRADKEAAELVDLVAKAKTEYVRTEQEILTIANVSGLWARRK